MVQDTRPAGPRAEPSEQTLANVMAMMAGRSPLHPEDRQQVEKAFQLAERLQRETREERRYGRRRHSSRLCDEQGAQGRVLSARGRAQATGARPPRR